MAELTPTSRPSMEISAPPELPGLMAASVWMKKLRSETPTWVRASAETMPLVTVCPTPKGLPMARTRSPTSSSSESRNSRYGNGSPPSSMRTTARSVFSSVPTTEASNSRRSARTTVISSAPSITWWLVIMVPLESTMTPEPSEFWTRLRSGPAPKPKPSPKKRRKKGSLNSGENCRVRTTLRV